MNAKQLAAIKNKLRLDRQVLEESLAANPDASGVVELDQTRQGRVSRIDAMQQQAMAQANQASGRRRLVAIDAALSRIEEGFYGQCAECGESIAAARLAARPEVRMCLECKAASEAP